MIRYREIVNIPLDFLESLVNVARKYFDIPHILRIEFHYDDVKIYVNFPPKNQCPAEMLKEISPLMDSGLPCLGSVGDDWILNV